MEDNRRLLSLGGDLDHRGARRAFAQRDGADLLQGRVEYVRGAGRSARARARLDGIGPPLAVDRDPGIERDRCALPRPAQHLVAVGIEDHQAVDE